MIRHRSLIVGWEGGVGSALVSLLQAHPAGRRVAATQDAIIFGGHLDEAALARLLREHRIDQVIEVADIDTLAFSAVCARHNANFLASSMQRDGDGDDTLTMVAARALLPGRRPDVGRASHLIGSGMNPGIVNALVFAGLEELARRVGKSPGSSGVPAAEPASAKALSDALDIYAIHVTEQDTTELVGGTFDAGEFPMSWSPKHALAEMLEPHAMYMANGTLQRFAHRTPDRLYRARCGAEEIDAMVVPHEELVTLGAMFAPVESAFLYQIPPVAYAALRRERERGIDAWKPRRLYPPYETALEGNDRVGVVLCSRKYGELWIGFDTPMELGRRYGTNGTLLQAATGVLAGWTLLGAREGIHVVEDLDWRAYLAVVEEVLGPAEIHHVPDAPVKMLAERVVPA